MHIRNPIEWGVDAVKQATHGVEAANRGVHWAETDAHPTLPTVRKIGIADIKDALAKGVNDFGTNRTDVMFLCVLYPVIGLVLGTLAAGHGLLPLVFPLASGFALLGPFAGLGLYEMSRRREMGAGDGWSDMFRVLNSPSLGAIVLLGLVLAGIYVTWLLAAYTIYMVTLGPLPPVSIDAFTHALFLTFRGWVMIGVGVGIGFLFAVLVLTISVVAFPLMLDRDIGFQTAVVTSAKAVAANPGIMALWGIIIAAGLVLGSIPLFVGLAIVLPVLGHATWHLYRKIVVPPRSVP
jgi:uncharacterized membrane protein